jgi:hypothetical protein
MEATEAAGELVSSPNFANVLMKTLKQPDNAQPVPYFEILLRIRAVAGTPGTSQILTYRLIQPRAS